MCLEIGVETLSGLEKGIDRMTAGTKLWIAAVIAWIALPWMLWFAADLYTLALHQVYYWPFARLLGQPFFVPDGDLGFVATSRGCILVAGLYTLLAGIIYFLQRGFRS